MLLPGARQLPDGGRLRRVLTCALDEPPGRDRAMDNAHRRRRRRRESGDRRVGFDAATSPPGTERSLSRGPFDVHPHLCRRPRVGMSHSASTSRSRERGIGKAGGGIGRAAGMERHRDNDLVRRCLPGARQSWSPRRDRGPRFRRCRGCSVRAARTASVDARRDSRHRRGAGRSSSAMALHVSRRSRRTPSARNHSFGMLPPRRRRSRPTTTR